MAIGTRISCSVLLLSFFAVAAERKQLAAGVITLSAPIVVPEGVEDFELLGAPEGTTLRAADGFTGAALVVARKPVRLIIRSLSLDGNRSVVGKPLGFPPHDVAFAQFTPANGILVEDGAAVLVENVRAREIAGFAILVTRSRDVKIRRVTVEDSGGRNARGRNNTSGGVLLEEGTANFEITDSTFRNVLGNGAWTHSLYTSPRNRDGLIARNRFESIGRDAIQVGHATRITVERNTGAQIGYPVEAIDVENGGTPVAIDTAGNVDRSTYANNRFEEINGKCIDLDGFHDGRVDSNTCINRKPGNDYPFGHYGVVFNNTNPDMRSENVVVTGNTIDGAKYGGIFVIGRGHTIARNRLRNLNSSHCDECQFFEGEPELLRSGIYLGRRAERPDPATNIRVEENVISGYKMDKRCIAAAPGVKLDESTVRANECLTTEK